MDPFDIRIQFMKYLERLNGGYSTSTTAASYMLKYPEMQEDLYNCFVESFDKLPMNSRLNTLYLIHTICDNLKSTRPKVINPGEEIKHHEIKTKFERDLSKLVSKTVPPSYSGFINLEPAKNALDELIKQHYLDGQVILKVKNELENYNFKPNNEHKLDITTDELLKRMDEDRERAKRQKEDIWAINHDKEFAEFDKRWNSQGALTKLDYELMREDNEIVNASIRPL